MTANATPPVPADILARISDPRTPLREAFDLCAGTIDNGLFTAMRLHAATMEVERLHSSMPDVYPVSGRKPKGASDWGAKVLRDRRPNLGHGAEDIRWAFSDHETILGLGLTTVLNVPVVRVDTVLGTINFLRAGPAYSDDEAAAGQLLAAALAARGTYGD